MNQNVSTQRPYKSTTHDERYYQFTTGEIRGTVFFREEVKGSGQFIPAVALCHDKDAFSRKLGRTVARRKYFAEIGVGKNAVEPSSENAIMLLRTAKSQLFR